MDEDHLHDIFAGVAPVTIRRLFGGKGIYRDGLVFALEAFDRVWIKVDEETQPLFEAQGSQPFTYQGKSRTVSLPYWSLPEAALEEPEEAARWANLGIAASRRKAAARPPAKPKKPKAKKAV